MYIAHRGTLDIDSPDTVRSLLSDVPAARRDYRSVAVSVAGLGTQERADWEARLSRNLQSRGSDAAALGYGFALVLYGVYLWLNGMPVSAAFDALSVGVALVVGGAAVGKMMGLMLANRALHRSASALAQRLEREASLARGPSDPSQRWEAATPDSDYSRVA